MHHATLKSAVAKYAPLLAEGKDEAAIKTFIGSDPKGFSASEVEEIYSAVLTHEEGGDQQGDQGGDLNKAQKESKPSEKPTYEQWKCSISNNKATKLIIERKAVKITEEQANILNEGALYGSNAYASLYYLPE